MHCSPHAVVEDPSDWLDVEEDDAVNARVQAAESIVEEHYKGPGALILKDCLLSKIQNIALNAEISLRSAVWRNVAHKIVSIVQGSTFTEEDVNSGGLALATELSNQYPKVERNLLQEFVKAQLLLRQARIVVQQAEASQGAESLLSEGTVLGPSSFDRFGTRTAQRLMHALFLHSQNGLVP